MSLWKVDDYETSTLMSDYYQRLQQGTSRSEHFGKPNSQSLKHLLPPTPSYWAGFIFSGDWSAIDAF